MKDLVYMLMFLVLLWMVFTDSKPSELPVDEVRTAVGNAVQSASEITSTVNDGLDRAKQVNNVVSETVKIEMINPVELQPTPTLTINEPELSILDVRATAQVVTEQMKTPEPTETAVAEFVSSVPTPFILQNGGLPDSRPYSQNEQWQCLAMAHTGAIERLPVAQKSNCEYYNAGGE